MSVFKIQYQDKKKVMIPVNDRETYLRERTSEEQQRITQAARRIAHDYEIDLRVIGKDLCMQFE